MLIMVLIGSAIGLVSGCLIEFFDMQPFIATLSMMFLARGLASTLSTVPERLDPESPIKDARHAWKLIDGEKVNDLVMTPGVIIARSSWPAVCSSCTAPGSVARSTRSADRSRRPT